MANSLYDTAREGFLAGEIDYDTAVIKCALVRGYAYSAAHKYVSDAVGAGAVLVSTSAALTAKAVAAGVADAADVTHAAVPSGSAITAILLFQSSAVAGGADVAQSAQRLIGHFDAYTGLPVTPNGGDIVIAWDNGANKIFRI